MKFLLWLFFWPFLLPYYFLKKVINLSSGFQSNMSSGFKKLDNKISSYDNKEQKKALDSYRKQVGIKEVNLNEELYDY